MRNLILNTDSYKTSHYLQYPPGAEYVSSYIESRGGRWPSTLLFGLQAYLKEYLCCPITQADIDEAELLLSAHGVPFYRQGWQYILEHYQGYLPLAIEAVPEGSLVPTGNVLVQVVNTDPQCAWLTSYVETSLLRAIWYPTTVATQSRACRQLIARYLNDTADTLEGLPFTLHDFGARGASSEESAALGSAAHLVNFCGTDTLSGIVAARRYYNADMAGFSIPAAEHSTITSWGKDREGAAYANMLNQFAGPDRLVAVVSDSYDLWYAIDQLWGTELKEHIESTGGTLVIRPDSGDPLHVVPEAIDRLMNRFGHRVNHKGYRVLPDCVRLIQGDGVSYSSMAAILDALKARGISAENLTFGMGGELLQKVNRDTQKFAMKASAISINSRWQDIYKDPVTDPGKRSKRGRLALIRDAGGYQTIRKDELNGRYNELVTIYHNGDLLQEWGFDTIRQRAASDGLLND